MAHCKNCGLDMGHSHVGTLCLTCSNKRYLEIQDMTIEQIKEQELLDRLHFLLSDADKQYKLAIMNQHYSESEFYRGLQHGYQQTIKWIKEWDG